MMTMQSKSWRHRSFIGGIALMSLMAFGCDSLPEGEPNLPPNPGLSLPDGLEIDTSRTSADAATSVRNLNSQVQGMEDALARNPSFHLYREQLVSLRLERSRFLGSYAEDFGRAIELVQEATERWPDEASLWRLQARVERALHRFDDAIESLDRAAAIDGSDDSAARAVLALARGENLEAHDAAVRARAEQYPNPSNLSLLAAIEAGQGRFEEADGHYRAALAAYRDNSPFYLAQIQFQRGVMWGEMADRADYAEALYRDAVRYLPGYVVANVHLAELEIEAGHRESALERLERVVDGGDPEPAGRLAQYIFEEDEARSGELAARATEVYDGLLRDYRLAFADHGSEFFTGAGQDAERARRLAEDNLLNRRDARAFLVAIRAVLAAEDMERACALAAEAQPLAPAHPTLASELEEVLPSCG